MAELYQGTLKVKSTLIFGEPGQGKTAIAVCMANDYERIYSNIEIFRYGKKINTSISNMDDIQKIKFNPLKKGVIIIDEMGVNGNARRSQSAENMSFGELDMLKRKKNCDVIWIAQLHRMFDVYQRELAQLIIEMQMIGKTFYVKRMEVKMNKGNKLWYTSEHTFDIFEYHKLCHLSYDQLSESKISKSKNENDISGNKKTETLLS